MRLIIVLFIHFWIAEAWAYSIELSGGQSHYRMETDQTGIVSEYLFKPAWSAQLNINFQLTAFQEANIFVDYMGMELETDNVPLPVAKDDFTYTKWGANYSVWFNLGFAFNLGLGNETLPHYSIESQTVQFEKYNPMYGTLGMHWRAKNQISTIEIGYTYKNLFYSSTDLDAEGFSNQIHFVIDFGRKQNIKNGAEVFYTDHNNEGNWGIKFTYENSQIESLFETTLDERQVELYFRMRFNSNEQN